MSIYKIIKKTLDAHLLPLGILSSHLRRRKADKARTQNGDSVTINQDEYVVYRIVSTPNIYGGGKPIARRVYIDINYYYTYDETDPRTETITERINNLVKAFLADRRFTLANGQRDLYDSDTPRGINVELMYLEAATHEQ